MSLVGVEVGQTIFVYDVANGTRVGRTGDELPVTKVTKQTVYAQQYSRTLAFSIEDGRQKQNAYCHLRAWKSRSDFDAEHERGRAWSSFQELIRFGRAPEHLTTEQIQQMIDLLKGKA